MEHEPNELNLVFRALRKTPTPDPEARARLDAALKHVRRPSGLWLQPSRWIPLAMAASLTLAVVAGRAMQSREAGRVVPGVAQAGTQPVQFVIVASDAATVSLVGDFNDWDPGAAPLERGEGGVWSVVLPLRSGQFTYSFLVNGEEWRADPAAPRAGGEDFGRPSSIVLVARREI
jgi:hypothetical protein